MQRKIQFLKFILNIAIKSAYRKWREQVFGFKGGDPRIKLALIDERDRIRNLFYLPAKERRKNLIKMHKERI